MKHHYRQTERWADIIPDETMSMDEPALLRRKEAALDTIERLRAFILAEAVADAEDCRHWDQNRIDAEVADMLVRAGIGKEIKP
jgi:hypothetical protein